MASTTARAVRVEVGLTPDKASTLSSLLESIRISSSTRTTIEWRQTYKRAFSSLPGGSWHLTPGPGSSPAQGSPPDCPSYKSFRLISPRIRNDQDRSRCAAFLKTIEGLVKLNPTTGLRLHVDGTGLTCEGLKKVCQNFVKYEDAIDSFLPPSRGTGSPESQRFFQSNQQALGLATKKKRNDAISAIENVESLILLMNPEGSNYKLNIRNLTSTHPMIEFRGHSSTSNEKKIAAWVALCLDLVATADGKRPASLKESRGLDEEFDALFKNIVKVPWLRAYYEGRRAELAVPNTGTTKLVVVKCASSEGSPKKAKLPKKQECGCCFKVSPISTMCPCQARNHWFCQQCVRKYAETQLFSNMSSKMKCLSIEGCTSHLNTIHLKRAVPKKVTEKLVECQYLESVERKRKVLSKCPKCDKSEVILPKEETSCICPLATCGYKWCRLCNNAPHEPLDCAEAAKQKRVTNARTSIEESMASAYVRKCPRCNVPFVRQSGCNKMTCPSRGCGALSCYVCRQLIHGVDHFHPSSGCPLYSDGDMTDRRLVQKAGAATANRLTTETGINGLAGVVQKLI